MFLNPPLKPDPVNRTFLLGTIRTLSFGGDTAWSPEPNSRPVGVVGMVGVFRAAVVSTVDRRLQILEGLD